MRLALIGETVRSHRVATVTWIVAGSAAMYAVALSLSSEMKRFAGGPQAFAESLRGGIEALRPLRWPADRLDTLGGYLWYHNVTLFTLFLGIYAAVQGARAVRGAEDGHSLEEILATGWSRRAVILDRVLGFAMTLLLISLGLGAGVALSMAAGGEPDTTGSVLTMLAAGLCALVAYSLGLLVSQLTATSRAAAGITCLGLSVLYVGTNVSGEIGIAGAVRFLSPFHYANASRVLVPGHRFDLAAAAVLALMAVAILGASVWAFERRDYRSALWVRRPTEAAAEPARVQRPLLRWVWTATLLRGRVGLLAWSLAAAAYAGMLASLQPSVMDAWKSFESIAGMAGGGPSISPERQYMSLAGEIVTAIIAAYVVTQAAAWVADLDQGRVETLLAGPMSWSRLVVERILAATVGVTAIAVTALGTLALTAAAVGARVHAVGLVRTGAGCVFLGVALAAVAALIVAVFRSGLAVTALAVFVAASYLLNLLVPLFAWPRWLTKASIFGALGHPYLDWPPLAGVLVLLVLAIGGGLAAAGVAERSPKVA